MGVFYISHRLPEVKQIADKVTVPRDGRVVARHPTNELQPVDMARLMVGRDVAKLYPDRHAEGDRQTILEVEDFSVPGFAQHASFQLGKGEILGFAGLVGAGRTELMEGLVGLRPGRGAIRINGEPTQFPHVDASLKAGIAYLSEDRKGKGLLLAEDLRAPRWTNFGDGFRSTGRRSASPSTGRSASLTSVPAARTCLSASFPAAISRNCCWPR